MTIFAALSPPLLEWPLFDRQRKMAERLAQKSKGGEESRVSTEAKVRVQQMEESLSERWAREGLVYS